MRAGKLDRVIAIVRVTSETDEYGNPIETETTVATLRAQLIEASTEEFQRAYGASGETATIFRTRYLDGLTLADRVVYEDDTHNIVEIKEIGRRRGLEIRCSHLGG